MEIKDQNQALNILVNTAKIAVKRGAFEIEETEVILKAIRMFQPEQLPQVEEVKKEEKETV